jgi:hypothetical protein
MNIRTVGQQYINQTWHLVKGYIAESQKHGGGDYNTEHVKVYLTTGQWILIVAVDENNVIHGAMTITFNNYPNHRVAFITATGGRGIITRDTLKQLKEILKDLGATRIRSAVRPSMERLLYRVGFFKRYTIAETQI